MYYLLPPLFYKEILSGCIFMKLYYSRQVRRWKRQGYGIFSRQNDSLNFKYILKHKPSAPSEFLNRCSSSLSQ